MKQSQAEMTGKAGGLRWWTLLMLFVVVALVAVGGRELAGLLGSFTGWVKGQGPLGALWFGVAYAVMTVAMVPGSVLTLAAGAIYGVVTGSLLVFFAATAGSILAFGITRRFARNWVEHRVESNPKFAAIDRALGRSGLRIVFLLRLSPVFPFNLLNYALGLTRVSWRDYTVASLGMIPGTLLYVYTGALAGEAVRVAGGVSAARGPGWWAVTGLGLAATAAVTVYITKISREALRQSSGGELG